MIGPHRVEGYAIVSADGMIADGNGVMPRSIRNDADQNSCNPSSIALLLSCTAAVRTKTDRMPGAASA